MTPHVLAVIRPVVTQGTVSSWTVDRKRFLDHTWLLRLERAVPMSG